MGGTCCRLHQEVLPSKTIVLVGDRPGIPLAGLKSILAWSGYLVYRYFRLRNGRHNLELCLDPRVVNSVPGRYRVLKSAGDGL